MYHGPFISFAKHHERMRVNIEHQSEHAALSDFCCYASLHIKFSIYDLIHAIIELKHTLESTSPRDCINVI